LDFGFCSACGTKMLLFMISNVAVAVVAAAAAAAVVVEVVAVVVVVLGQTCPACLSLDGIDRLR
jgi:hypothetical protein